MITRERRSWTEQEDELLRNAVLREDPDSHPPSKWHLIAKHVPNRTNKDCRKRWFAKMATVVAKGGWSADEDERLIRAVERYGTKWSLVAAMVQTRNNDQCAKRWSDTLNPNIDRTTWSPEEDAQLLEAVQTIGKSWTRIVKTYFPGRTGLSAKNRYSRLMRINNEPSRGGRPRRSSVGSSPYRTRHRSSTVTSTCSDQPSTYYHLPDSPYGFLSDFSDTLSTHGSVSTGDSHSVTPQTPEVHVMISPLLPNGAINPHHPISNLSTIPATPNASIFDGLKIESAVQPCNSASPQKYPDGAFAFTPDFIDPNLFGTQINQYSWPTQSGLTYADESRALFPSTLSHDSNPDLGLTHFDASENQDFLILPQSSALPTEASGPHPLSPTPHRPYQTSKSVPTSQTNDSSQMSFPLGDVNLELKSENIVGQSFMKMTRTPDNRVAVAVAVAVCEPQDLQATVHTLVDDLWDTFGPPSNLRLST